MATLAGTIFLTQSLTNLCMEDKDSRNRRQEMTPKAKLTLPSNRSSLVSTSVSNLPDFDPVFKLKSRLYRLERDLEIANWDLGMTSASNERLRARIDGGRRDIISIKSTIGVLSADIEETHKARQMIRNRVSEDGKTIKLFALKSHRLQNEYVEFESKATETLYTLHKSQRILPTLSKTDSNFTGLTERKERRALLAFLLQKGIAKANQTREELNQYIARIRLLRTGFATLEHKLEIRGPAQLAGKIVSLISAHSRCEDYFRAISEETVKLEMRINNSWDIVHSFTSDRQAKCDAARIQKESIITRTEALIKSINQTQITLNVFQLKFRELAPHLRELRHLFDSSGIKSTISVHFSHKATRPEIATMRLFLSELQDKMGQANTVWSGLAVNLAVDLTTMQKKEFGKRAILDPSKLPKIEEEERKKAPMRKKPKK